MAPSDAGASGLNARLERLEEAVLFAERSGEQLSESLADLSRRLEAVTQRLARLEDRLGRVEVRAPESPGPGPHAPEDDDPP